MLEDLKTGNKLVGLKQSTRAVSEGNVIRAFVALDAQSSVKDPFVALCEQKQIPVEWVDSMDYLGKLCGISLGAAVAVLLEGIGA